uniref:Beta-1,4-glucuronyltransferase 1 n=1 Tax=Timema californicum TaxID=61474 RepID=A0A7R9JCV9_TIMCA|nr:unnamed protein product [Timema californicum]
MKGSRLHVTRICVLVGMFNFVLITTIMLIFKDTMKLNNLVVHPPWIVQYLDPSLGMLDSSGRYVAHVHSVVGSNWIKLSKRALSLATHASLEHLHWVAAIVADWPGPVSIALFVPDIEYHLATTYIAYLQTCYPNIQQQVSFHFLYPVDRPAQLFSEDDLKDVALECSISPKKVLEQLLTHRPLDLLTSWREQLLYPQNILRNIARKTSPTTFMMCVDIDMIMTSAAMNEQLEVFLSRNSTGGVRCAYVVPVYEIHSNFTLPPRNKKDLLNLVAEKNARPFHIKVFAKNQGISNLNRWEKLAVRNEVRVAYNVTKFKYWYEPIYIADKSAPLFDERFIGYGNTRNTQAMYFQSYEMFLNQWTFCVLDNVFLVHWGFQQLSQHSAWRTEQINKNNKLLADFFREMAVRYDADPFHFIKKFKKKSPQVSVVYNPSKVYSQIRARLEANLSFPDLANSTSGPDLVFFHMGLY